MVTGSAEFNPIAPLSPPPTNMKNDHQETCTYVCVWLAIAAPGRVTYRLVCLSETLETFTQWSQFKNVFYFSTEGRNTRYAKWPVSE